MSSGQLSGICKVTRFFLTASLVEQRQALLDKHGRNIKGVIDECLTNDRFDLMRAFIFGQNGKHINEHSLSDAYLLFYGTGVGIINLTRGEVIQEETVSNYQSDLERATVHAQSLIKTFA